MTTTGHFDDQDEAKARFLGKAPTGHEPDDPDGAGPISSVAAERMVATQITSGDPPEVWATAERLTALGLGREDVLLQLALACKFVVNAARLERRPVRPADYISTLDGLPLPPAPEIAATLIDVVRDHPGIGADDADQMVLGRLGRPDDGLVMRLVNRMTEMFAEDGRPLTWLSGGRAVHVEDLTAGVVMTHRLTSSERRLGVLTDGLDLAAFVRRDVLCLPDGQDIRVLSKETGTLSWLGPKGWLDEYEAGDLLAVRVGSVGVVFINAVRDAPALDETLVARLREIYEGEVGQRELPVTGEDLVLDLLLDDRDTFSVPRPPLAELCAAAGLERRGHEVAHTETLWVNASRVRRTVRIHQFLSTEASRYAAHDAIFAADDPDAHPQRLRRVMASLRDPDVLKIVTEELFGFDDDTKGVDHARDFSERLLEIARRPAEIAVARWLAAIVAERQGEALVADAHLALAIEADPHFYPAVDRAAWYASDKGDAATAVRLWRRVPEDRRPHADLAEVEPFSRPTGPKLSRNQPCWCGSGRKFKLCHLERPQAPPLPERIGWMYSKAAAYAERRGGRAIVDLMSLVDARALDPEDDASRVEALNDPLVVDIALTEGGWFDRFLADRGPLLPDDEALLFAAWSLVQRTVYEVVDTRPGVGLTLLDLGTGDRIDVRERTFSRQARRGQVICGRAVPDGETHQLVGGLFSVDAGTETEVLELCDEGRGHALCEYVAWQYRPRELQTREGEPLIACTAVVEIPDHAQARQILDHRYETADGRWFDVHALHEDDLIVRAQIELDGRQLTITTHSEPRMERVLDALRVAIPTLTVVSDERAPLAPGEFPTLPGGPVTTREVDSNDEIQRRHEGHERRWINKPHPALAGLTPVEAAADPTRIEQLERLLDSFPSPGSLPAGAIATVRPEQLRKLLGLPVRDPVA